MSGKRMPTEIVAANGKKHMSRAEEDARRDAEVHVPVPEAVTPPAWLPKKLHKEFVAIGEILSAAGLYAELDRDVLGQYFLSRDRWIAADKKAAAAIRKGDDKDARAWTTVQAAYFRQARQCAEHMGLSVTARCRIVVPQALENAAKAAGAESAGADEIMEVDEFTAILQQRQQTALAKSAEV